MTTKYKTWRGNASYPASVRIDQVLSSQGDGTGTIDSARDGIAITDASQGTPIVATGTAHGLSDGDFVYLSGIEGNTAANGMFIVQNKDANTFELTDTDGGTPEPNGAYTTGGTAHMCFAIKPPASTLYHLERMNIAAGDNAAVSADTYLGLPALTNGFVVEVRNATDGVVATLTPTPVKHWNMWSLGAGVDTPVLDLTANETAAAVRWTFSKSGPLMSLDGDLGDYLVFRPQDSVAGLDYQYVAVQGVL